MTDFSKWTDKQINEAIFKAKGWTRVVREFESDGHKQQYTLWKNPDPACYGQYTGAPDDYTHDWQLAGELLEELPADVRARVVIGNRENMKRNACIEWLAWKGVE